ncbi:MAG: HDOD domain-containing protein [Rhodoferax sp.]|uniref:HDOD domain-containing protein n=1 Tax=Rhodoferax sp. TaxID=50421 RepID=UPI001839F1E1|nr:HDOD domain-containing protein [Rhodoferax sp.]NMM18523.1 HDOD domain-containing protein [Rhodoferax sp.]
MTDQPSPDKIAATPAAPAPAPVTTPYLTEPLPDLAAWTRYFQEAEIPVLAATAQKLEALRAIEDDVDAGMLSAVIESDPLMTLKVLAYVSANRRTSDTTETESITSSLVMMGIAPFFRNFGRQPTVEDQLHNQPLALEGLRELLTRAERAGQFAVGFAVHRGDLDVGVIHLAAVLHDFAEMLMWCHAPTIQLEISAMQRANPTLRTASLQRFVYNIELNDLRHALMKLYRLPELLVRISDGKHPTHANVRNVLLAVRLARHTMHGWDNAALPDDINDIALLLNASPRVALAFVHKINHPV